MNPGAFLQEWGTDAVLVMSLIAAVFTDLRWRRIPDWITLPTALAGLALAALGGWGTVWHPPSLSGSLAGAVVAGGFFLLVGLTGGVGMGDVKLMAALGALLGARDVLGAGLFIAIAGGLQGILAWLLGTSPGRAVAMRLGVKGADTPEFGKSVPYGVAIAIGTAVFRLWQQAGA